MQTALELIAGGPHAHCNWGRTPAGFAIANEVAYFPAVLCDKWASLVKEALHSNVQKSLQTHGSSPDKNARAPTGKQNKLSPVMVRDYHEVKVAIVSADQNQLSPRQKLSHASVANDKVVILAYARVLRVTPILGGTE